MSEATEAVTARFWSEVWNKRDLDVLEELFHPEFVLHLAGASFSGIAAMRASFETQWFEPFPDLAVKTVVTFSSDDLVADSLVFTGTHSGTAFHPGLFQARGLPAVPAEGAAIEFTQTCLTRVEGCQMVEMFEDFDRVRLFLQLGVGLEVPSG
jgi:predicted ester cyclase